ncbi:MAG: hypothetical protein ACTIJ2_14235 [Sphingobacteriaceae bacterium]
MITKGIKSIMECQTARLLFMRYVETALPVCGVLEVIIQSFFKTSTGDATEQIFILGDGNF